MEAHQVEMVRLESVLESYIPSIVSGLYFRFVAPEYASDPLSTAGTMKAGGRYNPAGICALYASNNAHVAIEEMINSFEHWLDVKKDRLPLTLFIIEVELVKSIDIQAQDIYRKLEEFGVSKKDLTMREWRNLVKLGKQPITQRIGGAAAGIGLEALKVPPAWHPDGHNLVIFPNNIRPPSRLRCTGIVTQVMRRPVFWPPETLNS
jgi:RES domain-containing protein